MFFRWRFPYIFLMYVTIEYIILGELFSRFGGEQVPLRLVDYSFMGVLCFNFTGIFLMISLTNRGLFCSNVSIVESSINPTIYCTITGDHNLKHSWSNFFSLDFIVDTKFFAYMHFL